MHTDYVIGNTYLPLFFTTKHRNVQFHTSWGGAGDVKNCDISLSAFPEFKTFSLEILH
jgi:hypothetical protein